MVLSDISCDVHGSIEFLERTTTIERPVFQYDPITEREIASEITDHGVSVLGVDILPSEFPRDSSEHFGRALMDVVQEIIDVKAKQDPKVLGLDTSLLSQPLVRCLIGDSCLF
jgi:alpha-aminoadipic semialdehyde synthase